MIRYIKETLRYGLILHRNSSLNLYAFCDVDWSGYRDTRRSTSGSCIYLGSNCIAWSSKKQSTVAWSSSEANYRSMTSTTADLTWIMFLLRDIKISIFKPPQLLCDNMSVIHMAKNPVFHTRTKHIEMDYHLVRGKVSIGHLITRFVPSEK